MPLIALDLQLQPGHPETDELKARRLEPLDLFGDLPPRHIRTLFDAAAVIDLAGLPRGVWLGRKGGGTRAFKWIARRIVRRDHFAKLLIEDWGINMRVEQNATFACKADHRDSPLVDLPFCINWDTFDYGYHIMGQDLPQPPLMIQDELRALALSELHEHVPVSQIERIGLTLGEAAMAPGGAGLLLVGYASPFGIHRFRGTPFAMVYHRKGAAAETRAARNHVARMRILDSSPGPRRCRAQEPAAVPFPT